MEELNKSLNLIEKNHHKVTILNIFLKFENKTYDAFFTNIVKQFQNIKNFSNCELLFQKLTNEEINNINYIKTYTAIEKTNLNYILFNPKLYQNIQEQTINFPYITFQDENISTINTNKLKTYILSEKNFITDFVKKKNKKKTIISGLWNNSTFGNNNQNKNLNTFKTTNEFNSKEYIQCKDSDYKIKKIIKIKLIINEEQIITNVRLILPNSFAIALSDNSYIYLNKIIISNTLTLGTKNFKNITEKKKYMFDLYYRIFKINPNNLNISFSISLTITDLPIENKTILQVNINPQITYSKEKITIKYISSFEQLTKSYNEIEQYKKKYEKYEKYNNMLKQHNISILLLSNKTIDFLLD